MDAATEEVKRNQGVRQAILFACIWGVRVYTRAYYSFAPILPMITDDLQTRPTFASSVTIDWSRDHPQKKADSSQLLQWVQNFPSRDDVHIYLGNVSFNGQRVLMRQLQAMGCTVTCRQYQS